MDLPRRLERRTAVDQHNALGGHYHADVGVQPLVVVAAATGVADVGIDTLGDTHKTHLDRACRAARDCQPKDRHSRQPAARRSPEPLRGARCGHQAPGSAHGLM